MTAPSTKTWLPHLRLSFGGAIGVPELEVWSNTVNFGRPDPGAAPSFDELVLIAAGIAPHLQTWFTGGNATIGSAAGLKWIKANWITAAGKYRDPNTVQYDYPAPVFGIVNTNPIWEQTYAITLRTALHRGRGHAGRVYPPLCGNPPQAKTPYLDKGTADAMAIGFADVLAHAEGVIAATLAGGLGRSLFASVLSAGDSLTGRAPLINRITSAVVDRVPDIQHRRTNRVPRNEGASSPIVEIAV